MASVAREFDCIIFGGGLAGSLLAWTLIESGRNPLLVNKAGLSNCSRVAAGLVNPIGGRRMNLAWEAEKQIPFAKKTYEKLGLQFGESFYFPRKIVRLLGDLESQIAWEAKSNQGPYRHWILDNSELVLPKQSPTADAAYFGITGGGYLDIPALLGSLHSNLESQGCLEQAQFDYSDIKTGADCVNWKLTRAPIAIFAEGWLGQQNPWLSFIPFRPAKGVIGKIQTNIDFFDTVIVDKFFLLPRNDGSIQVGATYAWDELDEFPDSESVSELETFLQSHLENDWEWLDVAAGIRPSIPGAKPIVGPHPENDRIFVFNGFGSKGATQIPLFAQRLHDAIWKGSSLPAESAPSRFRKDDSKQSKRWIAVEIARDRILKRLDFGDVAIDATAGNGNDTLWLANAVGSQGHVYAFDIQKEAIELARKKLDRAGCSKRVSLIHECHSRIQENIPRNKLAKAIVFNLGYLPKGEKSLITQSKTTIEALETSLNLLQPEGMLSIVAYPGHPGGKEETEALLDWYENIDTDQYTKQSTANPSGNPKSPIIFFLTKRDG